MKTELYVYDNTDFHIAKHYITEKEKELNYRFLCEYDMENRVIIFPQKDFFRSSKAFFKKINLNTKLYINKDL